MTKIDIIGRGNVASHLKKAFASKSDVNIVNPHTLSDLREDSDLYLISVKDDAIPIVAKKLKARVSKDSIVAHTSGTTPLSALNGVCRNTGVFYPLQTFSKDVELKYSEIPIFIEGNSKRVEKLLKDSASLISKRVSMADSGKRRDLHIASVFCCNFTNHLWTLADEYLTKHGLDFKTLLPLIMETTRKASVSGPASSQTGPAVRHDQGILDAHCRRLEEEMEPELQDIYSLLSLSIMSHHPKK